MKTLADPPVQPIKVATTNWQPFMISDTDQVTGIDAEIARLVVEKLRATATFRRCPFKRCLAEMEKGVLDLQSGIAFNEERNKYLLYLEPSYSKVSVKFYTKIGKNSILSRYEDLYDAKVGSVVKSHYFEPFNSDLKINKHEAFREEDLFPLLQKGRIDVIIGTNPNLDFQVLQHGLKGEFEATKYDPQKEVPLYFAISRKSPLISYAEQISAILQELKDNGTFEKIESKYR